MPQPGVYVLCSSGDRRYAIHTIWTSELNVNVGASLTRVPNSPSALLGLINLRGKPLPLISLRHVLGQKTQQQEVTDLVEFLKAREQDHVIWFEGLQAAVHQGKEFKGQLDPCKCNFGKWYVSLNSNAKAVEEFAGNNSYVKSILEALDHPHRNLHECGARALVALEAGQKAEALAALDQARTSFEQLNSLFQTLMRVFAESRRSTIITMDAGADAFALAVDAVERVIDLEEDDFVDVPESSRSEELADILTACVQIDEDIVLVLQPDALVKTAVAA